MTELASIRAQYAEALRSASALQTPLLVRAFATVPRERFVGPGPWQIIEPSGGDFSYRRTPDGDPRHLYQNVLVALDPTRHLNNGLPSGLALWLDALALRPGEHVVHVGCGSGYYAAIIAEVVGPAGRVSALEVDPQLVQAARANLQPWPHVEVIHANGADHDPGPCDAILVNAGMTHPAAHWTGRIRPEGGRFLMPLTFDEPSSTIGIGAFFLHRARGPRAYDVKFVSSTVIFSAEGARDPDLNSRLKAAYTAGGAETVRSLHLAPEHDTGPDCWLHSDPFCYSKRELP